MQVFTVHTKNVSHPIKILRISRDVVLVFVIVATGVVGNTMLVSSGGFCVQESKRAYVIPSRVEPLYKCYYRNGLVCLYSVLHETS